jgi:hypothetical protein
VPSATPITVVPVDLFVFENRAGPRRPHPGQDLFPDAAGLVGPETPPRVNGSSSFADPTRAPLTGHYHRLPAGTVLPEGLAVVADGSDVDPGSPHAATHHTIYPATGLTADRFIELFLGLPWQYAGRQ